MRGGPDYAARIKCAGRNGPARGVRALCGAGLNGAGRPVLPPLRITKSQRANWVFHKNNWGVVGNYGVVKRKRWVSIVVLMYRLIFFSFNILKLILNETCALWEILPTLIKLLIFYIRVSNPKSQTFL